MLFLRANRPLPTELLPHANPARFAEIEQAEQEQKRLTAGDSFPVFQTRHGKVGMSICWDMMFPEVSQCLRVNGAEIIPLPAGRAAVFWDDERRGEYWNAKRALRALYDGGPDEYLMLVEDDASFDPGSGLGDIWIHDLQNDMRTRLTFDPGDDGAQDLKLILNRISEMDQTHSNASRQQARIIRLALLVMLAAFSCRDLYSQEPAPTPGFAEFAFWSGKSLAPGGSPALGGAIGGGWGERTALMVEFSRTNLGSHALGVSPEGPPYPPISGGRTRRGSARSLSAITRTRRPRRSASACTAVVSSSRTCTADGSTMACTASSRRPSTWKSRTQARAFSITWRRTPAASGPS